MKNKLDPDNSGSPSPALRLLIGAALYLAGFLAVVYGAGLGKLPLGPWAPYIVVAPQSTNATPSPMPLNSSSPSPLLVSSATLTPTVHAPVKALTGAHRAAQLKVPRAAVSPCATPSNKSASRKRAPSVPGANNARLAVNTSTTPAPRPIATAPAATAIAARPARSVSAAPAEPATRPLAPRTAHPPRSVRGTAVARGAISHPTAKPNDARTAADEEQRGSSVLLLPVPKSRAARVTNELDPRAGESGSLLINPSAAPPPAASSSAAQTQ